MLPFLARGYTPDQGPYKRQLDKALSFLVSQIKMQQGQVARSAQDVFSLAASAYAICEAVELDDDPALVVPARFAFRKMLAAQGRDGGWGGGTAGKSDTLTTAFVISAVTAAPSQWKSFSPKDALGRATRFLHSVERNEGAEFGFSLPDDRPDQADTTAAGLASRLRFGRSKDTWEFQAAVMPLIRKGPTKDILRDYYATQVAWQREGDLWLQWNTKMRELLVKCQSKEGCSKGSWYDGVAENPLAEEYGRLWTTVFATLTLEIYHRYAPVQVEK
jgi:hypothetical protein